ncbi:phycobilisome linker polypeptide [Synechococcales cyanobacterium C]|uniref:Phycobilisome linker polypeptide n=1 Tax=Petrachloros mirabilis ULC683 TaxID=2781853 RepID=A0A8K2A0M2_9CYAN|nr:phycobilisome linker polypeptide [Petrachloros mirabilis]NCJ07192.1 phycobilisome linker polypeptide [Petrachloros mirabilis ULC683]
MLSQSAFSLGPNSVASDRVFVYEVQGLRQNDVTSQNAYPVRNSSNIEMQVPYSRMNEQMRRITRMGGKIVGIRSLAQSKAAISAAAPAAANSGGTAKA